MINLPFGAGGVIFMCMGLVHGVQSLADVFRPRQFTPTDDAVRLAMKSTTVRFLSAPATIWNAWLGFNLSHSVGMFVFGALVLWFANDEHLFKALEPYLFAPLVIGLVYLLLSIRFWFYAPTIAFAAATACFAAAWWN